MNDLKIDKLFHEKLVSFEVQPSNDAWNRIEANAPKKKTRSIWYFAVAASLTIILASVYLLLNNDSIEETGINNNQIAVLDQTPNPLSIEESQPFIENTRKEIVVLDKNYKTTTNSVATHVVSTMIIHNEKNTLEIADVTNYSKSELNFTLHRRTPELNLVNAQLIPEPELLPEYGTDLTLPENESGLRKMYEYAKRVKNGEENPIDLRKAKDDLFAMAKNIKFNQSKVN